MPTKEVPTTEHLTELIERAVLVPEENWSDRDTPDAVAKLGKAWAYLKSGCSWHLAGDPESTKNTWWIEIKHYTFNSFEYGRDDPDYIDEELFYIPTQERLDASNGKDWY